MGKPFKIKLTVPEPCAENWEKMTPVEKGRFCSHCNKNVIDFSAYTNKELLDFFKSAKGQVCGHFNNWQLNKVITTNEPSNTPVYRRLLYSAALAAGVSTTVYAQSTDINKTDEIPTSQTTGEHKKDAPGLTYQISGIALDSVSHKPLSSANVVIKHMGEQISSVVTDREGHFSFNLNKNYTGSHLIISVTHYGYNDKSIKFVVNKFPMSLHPILLKESTNQTTYVTGAIAAPSPADSSSIVYTVVDTKPKFPEDINKYFTDNIRYPKDAKEKKIQGTVFVSFIIERDGSVSDVKILRSPNNSLSTEAIRVVSTMPKWTPGKQNGKAVRVQWMVPIHFNLPPASGGAIKQ